MIFVIFDRTVQRARFVNKSYVIYKEKRVIFIEMKKIHDSENIFPTIRVVKKMMYGFAGEEGVKIILYTSDCFDIM